LSRPWPRPDRRTRRRGAAAVAGLALLLAAASATAEEFRVEVSAPPPLRALLAENLDIARYAAAGKITEAQFQRLFTAMAGQARDLLATEGYFSPELSAALTRDGHVWNASLRVVPGQPSVVESVDIRFEGGVAGDAADFPDRRQRIREKWALRPGQRFRQAAWTEAKDQALGALLEEWFPAARIAASEARVDPERRSVALSLTLNSGPPVTLGGMGVSGLERYPPETVANLNRIAPGTPYSLKRLTDFQSALLNTGYFSSAFVTADVDPARPENTPIRVTVVESLPKKLRLGAGYSTDIGASGEVSYEFKDFLDRGWRLLTGAVVAQREQYAALGLQFLERPSGYRDGVGVVLKRKDIQNEITTSVNFTFSHAKRSEERDIEYLGDLIWEKKSLKDADLDNVLKSLVFNYSWLQRRVDSLTDPRAGYLLNLQGGGALQGLFSDQGFLRGYGRAALYVPLFERDRLLIRGELGAISSDGTEGIPSKYLFRTGGAQSVRGYPFESLGPRLADATVGGKYLAVVSAEYLHMFTPQWGGVLFLDAGNATDEWENFQFARGYGSGVRWKSPVGGVGLDLAYGELDKKVRVHFSIEFRF
jgi:translocation and assembly module TamA